MTVILLLLLPTLNKIHSAYRAAKRQALFFSPSSTSISALFKNVYYCSHGVRATVPVQASCTEQAPPALSAQAAAWKLPDGTGRPPNHSSLLDTGLPDVSHQCCSGGHICHHPLLPPRLFFSAQTKAGGLWGCRQGTDPTSVSHPVI